MGKTKCTSAQPVVNGLATLPENQPMVLPPINHDADTRVRCAYALLTYSFFGTISFTMRLINTPFFHITKYMHGFKAGCDEITACVLKDLEEQK